MNTQLALVALRAIAVVLLIAANTTARAGSISYEIGDIGNYTGYSSYDTDQTFTGTGFVGMYQDSFSHLLGLEKNGYSRTAAQVGIHDLADKTISSAYLAFDINNGINESQEIILSTFDSGGLLGHEWDARNPAISLSSDGLGTQLFDITALVADAVDSGIEWLGLHLMGTDEYQWSYTYSGYGYNADSAQMRLIVEYDDEQELPYTGFEDEQQLLPQLYDRPVDIPEPATLLLLFFGLLSLPYFNKCRNPANK